MKDNLRNEGLNRREQPQDQKKPINSELLRILVCPLDKGPLQLIVDDDYNIWLVNRRNGFRYPVRNGIPVMLIEEGMKYKDESLITIEPQ